jgi:putative hemolysin
VLCAASSKQENVTRRKVQRFYYNMVVTKLDVRVVSFDARKQTHKGAFDSVSSFLDIYFTLHSVFFIAVNYVP